MKIIEGNILELLPPGGVLFHQVNTLGKFGAGLALQIRRKWPGVAADYEDYCARTSPILGCYRVAEVDTDKPLPEAKARRVAHLFAQATIGRAGTGRHTNYTALAGAMARLAPFYRDRPCFFPYGMGCGLAGGNWEFVKILIEENFPNATIVKLPNA